jgi:hypothetical protein
MRGEIRSIEWSVQRRREGESEVRKDGEMREMKCEMFWMETAENIVEKYFLCRSE